MTGAPRNRRWLAALLLAGACGCQGMRAEPGLPDDPLFLDRKPLEAKAKHAPPVPPPFFEPVPPANPYYAEARTTSGDAPPPRE